MAVLKLALLLRSSSMRSLVGDDIRVAQLLQKANLDHGVYASEKRCRQANGTNFTQNLKKIGVRFPNSDLLHGEVAQGVPIEDVLQRRQGDFNALSHTAYLTQENRPVSTHPKFVFFLEEAVKISFCHVLGGKRRRGWLARRRGVIVV